MAENQVTDEGQNEMEAQETTQSVEMPERLRAVHDRVIPRLNEQYGTDTYSSTLYRDELSITVDKNFAHELIEFLKNDPGLAFTMLKDVHVVDWFRRKNRFEVIYNLYSIEHRARIRVKCFTEEKEPHVDTVTDLFRSADWYEREAYDMHGVFFDGHPDLRRMYMPEDFVHPDTGEPLYPLRKDFPVMGVPGSMPLPERDPAQGRPGTQSNGLPH